jgi:uncharacterized membrane protein YdbT with pleckstrin-like domain
MFCTKCGKENADDAVYCQKCGSEFTYDEDETRVAMRTKLVTELDAGDAESSSRIFSVTPTLKFVYIGYVLAVLGAFLLVALVSLFFASTFSIVTSVILGMALLLVPLFYHWRKKLIRYTLTDTTVEIDRGFISRTTQNIPLRRIQDVTVSATMMQRMLGFGSVISDNASEDGCKVILHDIDSPKKYADLMLRQMRLLEK